ncbi:hypothetical protein [Breznakia pachnodae]|uniref:Uncharacterized protein n=1 Tax=Breznakia pachnodae TaxID=265178 RepID=A0ABU0E8T3_9FIRM|nr:hypothetical protein [Breznakia pachnodae]MDQ0363225.1 hypothetical protein [Breznakia pachnodae]
MKKGIILGILILLLAGCNESKKKELKLVILDEQGNMQDAETIACSDTKCDDENERYFEVIKIKYDIDDQSSGITGINYESKLEADYEENDYIRDHIRQWKYTIVQDYMWVATGTINNDGWEYDLCFGRTGAGEDGEWVSLSDQEWDELIKATEELSQDKDMPFTFVVETNIPEGDSQQNNMETEEG